MVDSKVKILRKRIAKLDVDDFDLEAWKEVTMSVLTKVLQAEDYRLRRIDELKVDYGSWALRDATSSYNPLATAKKKGRELLESIVEELENNPNMVLADILPPALLDEINIGKSKSELIAMLGREKKDTLVESLAALLASK